MGMLIAAGLLTTGCSVGVADKAPTPPAIEVSPTPPATGYDGLLGLPLSAYGTSDKDDDQLFAARKALVVNCMKSRGHPSYLGQNMVWVSGGDNEARRPAGAWGYIGLTAAKRQGFHPGQSLPNVAGLTGAEDQDFQACQGAADKELPRLAGTSGWTLTQRLFAQSLQQTKADRRVSAARERWSACMTAAGRPAQDPEILAAGPWETAKPTVDEIAASTAAESCTTSSELAAVYFAVLTGYQRQLVSANATVLVAYRKQVQAQADQVSDLMAKLPAP
ncbi:hypothetical protein F7Q99_28760 [Streptomyces kaniharaensis]|uniref:Uncharacterized protein n=2 Tax=Streptomyces kaniharaensis TaxID=212423 RepID=A0A6N7KZX3_9ACTN|nr:hypothetical protein [Streptomyces kaniharaensis]